MFSDSIVDAAVRIFGFKACGWQAKRTAEIWAWEEFGETMEKDYRSASKRIWQALRRGK